MEQFDAIKSVQKLVEDVRADYTKVYAQWCAVGRTLAKHRGDAKGHAYEHLDVNCDLILRAIEADQLSAFKTFGEKIGGGVFFVQISLSKMWLFSIYEIVRQTCATACVGQINQSNYCGKPSCYRCSSLRPVRDRLNLFRIPLAKLQPEGRTPQTNYHAELVIDADNGSIGWRAKSARLGATEVTSRLVLSDYVLQTLCPD